jgi:hypothetical protein
MELMNGIGTWWKYEQGAIVVAQFKHSNHPLAIQAQYDILRRPVILRSH